MVLTLGIPAGRDLTAASVLDTPGFDAGAAYTQPATVWRTAGIEPGDPGASRRLPGTAFPLQGASAQPGWSVCRCPGAAMGP